MELSWINKLRIALVGLLGLVVIGILAWPAAAPADPLGPVRSTGVGLSGTVFLLVLAFGLGFVGYFVTWPHGREIGILTVPFGLAAWAVRSGPMRALTQSNPLPAEREALVQSLRFEPVYWLLIVAAGFAGVLAAEHLRPASESRLTLAKIKGQIKTDTVLTILMAAMIVVLVAQFLLGAFAQNVPTFIKPPAAQPATGQIVFAGLAAFVAAAFVAKKFFGLSYVWPTVASVLVVPFAEMAYCRGDTIAVFAETQPATSFPHAVLAILPIQLVAFAALGSVIGYWLAVQYDYWRTHEAA
ncbi:MAG: hypothetical protein JW993_15760 [Sedimentisphaerales bacterium]|nr:hypothetical protein [Sedimentisphaerales bacterium]